MIKNDHTLHAISTKYRIYTSSNQKITKCVLQDMWCDHGKLGYVREKQIENYGHAFLAGRADLNRCTRTRGPKPLKKARGAANLQFSKKISISRACETKLGCVLEEQENAITPLCSIYLPTVLSEKGHLVGKFSTRLSLCVKSLFRLFWTYTSNLCWVCRSRTRRATK